jgi:major coat protein
MSFRTKAAALAQKCNDKALQIGVGATLAVSSILAHAEIPASFDTAMTATTADATTLQGKVLPVVVAVMGLGIVIKLVKRFGNKI